MELKRSVRRFFAPTLLLFAIGILSPAADRTMTREEYVVYSVVLANIQLSHADNGEALAIALDTIDPHDLLPAQNCPSLPFEFRRHASSAHRKTLKNKKLVIGRRYILLTAQQVDLWRQQRFAPKMPTDPPAAKMVDPFAGTSDLIQLSNILFNAKKTVAFVYVSATCGSLCMSSQVVFAGKDQKRLASPANSRLRDDKLIPRPHFRIAISANPDSKSHSAEGSGVSTIGGSIIENI